MLILLHNNLDMGNNWHVKFDFFLNLGSSEIIMIWAHDFLPPCAIQWIMNDIPAARWHYKEYACGSCQAHCIVASSLFDFNIPFLFLSLLLSPVLIFLLTGVRTRKCVHHSRKTHILITNSRSRGLLPRLVVTPNPIFRPEWRVGESKSSMIRASERTSKQFAPDPVQAVSSPRIIIYRSQIPWIQICLLSSIKIRWYAKSEFIM